MMNVVLHQLTGKRWTASLERTASFPLNAQALQLRCDCLVTNTRHINGQAGKLGHHRIDARGRSAVIRRRSLQLVGGPCQHIEARVEPYPFGHEGEVIQARGKFLRYLRKDRQALIFYGGGTERRVGDAGAGVGEVGLHALKHGTMPLLLCLIFSAVNFATRRFDGKA